MIGYILQRIAYMIVLLLVLSVVKLIGDYIFRGTRKSTADLIAVNPEELEPCDIDERVKIPPRSVVVVLET
jgi:hypothetical protein